MPFGSRRFFTGRTINPAITTISFLSPQGSGSSQPTLFTSATISGDVAGNTVNGDGTYTSDGNADLPAGITGGPNNPICVPLTENRTYTIRLRKTTYQTISNGIHPTASYPYTDTAPRVGTVVSDDDPEDVVSTPPSISFSYGRVRNNSGPPEYQAGIQSIFNLVNHDRSSDVMRGAGGNPNASPQTHIFNFTSTGGSSNGYAMTGDTLTISQNFATAQGDNDTASPGYTAKGLILQYGIQNFGSGHQANVTIELFQS